MNLSPSNASSNASLYQSGHAFGKVYTSKLPEEGVLQADLETMIRLYRASTFKGIPDELRSPTDEEPTGESDSLLESNDRIRLHKRVERNRRLAKVVKKVQGTVCRACGFDYNRSYGELGKGFIEAHHNVPIAELPKDAAVPLDPRKDFTVLCANCHRMVHQRVPPLNLSEIKTIIDGQIALGKLGAAG